MKAFLLIPAIALAGGYAALAASGAQGPAERDAARTAELMAGRTAGTPVSCVNMRDLGSSRSSGDGGIIFEGPGRRIVYLNRPAGGCPDLGPGRTLITRTTTTRLCRGDIAQVVDPVSGIHYGGCGLGDFVPYRREARN